MAFLSIISFSKCLFIDHGWSYLLPSLQETARQNYVDLVSGLSSSSDSSSQVKPEADREQAGYETLVMTSEDGITKIMLNRPTKMNALTTQVTWPALGICPAFLSSVSFTQQLECFSIIAIFMISCLICAGRLVMVATSSYSWVEHLLFRICWLRVGSMCPKKHCNFPNDGSTNN